MSNTTGKYWPYGLIMAMILFILFFVYLVTRIYQSDYSLVSENSYEQGLQHDASQLAKARAIALGAVIEYYGVNTTLKIQFPDSISVNLLDGNVHFYRPSSAKLDFNVPLELSETKAQFLNLEKLEPGLWKVKLKFNYKNEAYYQEYSFSR